jgi:hypothetical protein
MSRQYAGQDHATARTVSSTGTGTRIIALTYITDSLRDLGVVTLRQEEAIERRILMEDIGPGIHA